MIENITEWEFTADIASGINTILSKVPELPFSQAKCEQRSPDSLKRRDLTLLDKDNVIVLTGEVKLPYRDDGGTPYNESVVQDARKKAVHAKTKYFFTWNVNEFVLWETFPAQTARKDRKYKSWPVTNIHKPSHLEIPSTTHAIDTWLSKFLHDFAAILRGKVQIGTQSPDEKFIEALESSLNMPIRFNLEFLENEYKKDHFRERLDKWMRDEQGWIIRYDPEGIRDNLERAAKFACYALVNKLVFHEALLKRYKDKISKLVVLDHIDKGDDLRLNLERFFNEAKKVTGDYETVFGEEHLDIGNRIPFYSNKAVPHWRSLINQIHEFDFSKLDYEIIGSIFERLIGPDERHKFGQFYTRVEVVDLINSFCIRTGIETVMDPACGGGTFLVRAYARKHELAPDRTHGELLNDIYGVDISHFATHLTTINLATRDLIDDENYPQIARNDFFNMQSNKSFLSLPNHVKTKGLGTLQHREITIPSLDAVVGNPPYIRQEEIRKSPKDIVPGTKEFYQELVEKEAHAILSGRSDIHCYFWPHATTFLKDDGYLCLLTSSQWLDVEYGFKLQEWILRHFQIFAIFESIAEPWFVGARVATAITILKRCKDKSERMNNTVRFVQLRRPLSEILAHDGTTAGAVETTNQFRDEILSLTKNTTNNKYRVRLISQGDLWEQGVRLGVIMGKSRESDIEEEEKNQNGHYYGGKWGVYLRAPDLWFDLLDRYGDRFVPLGDIAEVRFGVKSGKDCFFFPKDCSADLLAKYPYPHEFEDIYGVPRKLVESGKVKMVLCGEGRGEVHPIESKYLEPEIHSLMEIDGFTVKPEDCSKMILLISKKKSEIKDPYVLDYINWGEKQKYHEGSTCASRSSEEKEWYDLTGHKKGHLFWPMTQKYKHCIPINDFNLICNHNLFDLSLPDQSNIDVMGGILNSSFVILSKLQYGRFAGTEGTLKTEVIDVNMLLVPDYRKGTKKSQERIAFIFKKMKERKVLQLLSERRMRESAYMASKKKDELKKLSNESELNMSDRYDLDDAVLQLIGVRTKDERSSILFSLYDDLRYLFDRFRVIEERTNINKSISRNQGKIRPQMIAEEIYHDICDKEGHLLKQYDTHFFDKEKPYYVFDLPSDGIPQIQESLFNEHGVTFVKGKKTVGVVETKIPAQEKLVVLVAQSGVRGLVRFPLEEEECHRVYKTYEQFVHLRENRIRELIEGRTSDEDLQEKIYLSLIPLLNRSR